MLDKSLRNLYLLEGSKYVGNMALLFSIHQRLNTARAWPCPPEVFI